MEKLAQVVYETPKHSLNVVPPFFLAFFIPFAVAPQNIAAALCGVFYIWDIIKHKRFVEMGHWLAIFKWPFFMSLSLPCVLTVSTLLNDKNIETDLSRFWGGQFFWIFLPLLSLVVVSNLSKERRQKLFKMIAIIGLIWGLIALTQYLIGWRIKGMTIIDAPIRARGLYSHPLTFAYSVLLLWPFAVVRLFSQPKDIYSWFLFTGIAVCLYTSESRTVLAVALLVLVFNIFYSLKGKMRFGAFLLIATFSVGTMITPNPVSHKIKATFTGNFDNQSGYADDRLAFWHAHWLMVEEKPFIGHGIDLRKAYRSQYYERIGLTDIKKQYAAHNSFLQFWANGGIVRSYFLSHGLVGTC